ncbi:ABC transporter substrate-binding protein [Devosia yakushimensis]|uniref:ABC transporter substrate-binding protein n=1 Tax=Devosia yakushimensis TaxID=470028 RepID=A0ABQ5UGB2_9HYPH|nr:ABC transporter substrate-binding protein [Devosia yakushimensis]GLQ10664.1 ABC transporter substrate-binding protein [Devosia yakushimensis]
MKSQRPRVPLIPAAIACVLAMSPAVIPVFAEDIVVTDHENRQVVLTAPAERVVTIPMPMASGVIALSGGADTLVGLNPLSLTAIREGILGKIFPDALNISDAVTGTDFVPNVEALAEVNPDLVIQWGGRGPEIVDPLVNAGLTTLLIKYGTEELTREYMTMVATAIGKPERIDALVAWRDRVQQEIAAKTAGIAEADRPSVLYLGRSLSDITAAGNKGQYSSWYIELAGGKNAAAELDGSVSINREQIAQWDPEVILLNSFEPELDVSWVYDDPILSLTKAAQNRRVYKMPLGGYRWDPPSQESPLTWMWLAELLHPDLFNYDLRAEMTAAYKTLYNYELTDEDIDGIIWTAQQGTGLGYDQFAVN